MATSFKLSKNGVKSQSAIYDHTPTIW